MEIFHQSSQFNIHPHISLILLNVVSFYNIFNIYCRLMFQNEVIDRYNALYYAELQNNAQV